MELESFIGEVLDGKYRIEQLLGKGGMGAVYLATHLGTARPVALKIIAPQFMRHDEFVERFKREAQAAGRLRHPNVVDVTDFGFAHTAANERVAYLVMEYLDGCTLSEVLAEESRLPLDWVVDILEQVCSAVDEAHRQGVVHRDLKPDNIWLEPNRLGGYRVKVLDFGIAKLGDPPVTSDQASHNAPSIHTPAATTPAPNASISHNGVGHEAGTRLFDAEPGTRLFNDEAGTRLFDPLHATATARAPDSTAVTPDAAQDFTHSSIALDQATQLLLVAPVVPLVVEETDADKTRLLSSAHQTAQRQPDAARTASAPALGAAATAGLTRVGSIMGTPLYMSPEQCRGESLDARSDIYSLGVIAYQMLAGATPFAGDMLTVMRLHREQAAPPLREQYPKASKSVARLLASALAKDPAARPTSAAAFASALRAHAEGVGSLLRRSFALYSEHFPKFLRVSLAAHLPVIAVTLLLLIYELTDAAKTLPQVTAVTLAVVLGLLAFVANFLASSVITGLTVLIVTQLSLAPLRPVRIRDAYAVLRRRWRPFLNTSIRVSLRIVLGLVFGIVPGVVMLVRYTLYAPVVLMEGLEKRAARQRARELMQRSRRTVFIVVAIQFALPLVLTTLATHFALGAMKHDAGMWPKINSRLISLSTIVISPLISIMNALLYLKMRQIGGETLTATLEQFEGDEIKRSRWQQRMRERLTTHTRHG